MLNDIINKAKKVMTSPTDFFKSIKNEIGFKEAFEYYAIITLFPTIILLIILSFIEISLTIFGIIIFYYILTNISVFILSSISHIFVHLLGGRNGFHQTYKSIVYASTPNVLLSWLFYLEFIQDPLILILILILTVLSLLFYLYLYVKGISILQKISTLRAVVSVLSPFVILILLVVVTLIFFTFPY